ncbi:MAG: hypothetical protein LBV12_13215 [Puniceicoccales bacterium]|jgi:hypothetical protein|nr:hypothetical protein [Puniceicoccales bacterium]
MARKPKNNKPEGSRDWREVVAQEPSRISFAPDSKVARWRVIRKWIQAALLLVFFGLVGVIFVFAWKEIGIDAETPPYTGAAVRFETNQALTRDWFLNYTGIDSGKVLGIFEIKDKLSQLGQIKHASVQKLPTGELEVKITERMPILKMRALLPDGSEVNRVIAEDGIVYEGINYGDMVYRNIPWLTGSRPRRSEKGSYDEIKGIDVVAKLLKAARQSNPTLYLEWEEVSVREFVDGDPDSPGACLRIRLRENSQPPDAPHLREVVFSASEGECLREFYNFYAMPGFLDQILDILKKKNKAQYPLFDLYLSLENKTDPNRPKKEPRLIPVPPEEMR